MVPDDQVDLQAGLVVDQVELAPVYHLGADDLAGWAVKLWARQINSGRGPNVKPTPVGDSSAIPLSSE